MADRFDIKFVEEEFSKEGYTLISTSYKNAEQKLSVQCPKGHEWSVSFHSFRAGARCRPCSIKIRSKKRRLDIEKVREYFEVHGYKLLSDTYENVEKKLMVQCPEGHEWNTSLHNFKSGNRCYYCCNSDSSVNKKHTIEYVREQFESCGYKLITDNYVNNRQKIEVMCSENHKWITTYHEFKQGNRCKTCFELNRGASLRLSHEHVKKYFESQGYKLLTDTYNNIYQKLDVICPNKHTWSVNWANFKNNNCRCAKCPTQTSKAEVEIYDFLRVYFPDAISGDRSIIRPLELDIVLPSKKIAIEYCGIYWHSDSVKKDTNYHVNKLNLCNEKGYRLITIFEDEWYNRKEIVKNTIENILGIDTSTVIYARKCEIREITSKEAREFFDSNHLQGYSESSIRYGAFYENKLIASMTFSKPNISRNVKVEDDVYELNRFCTKCGYRVQGIASKLFKHFLNNVYTKKVYTYSDRRWFDGKVYEILGFSRIKINPPSYWYVKNNNYRRYHRFNFRKGVLDKKLEKFDPELTEYENMLANHYRRIWDCGTIKYELNNQQSEHVMPYV